MADLLDRPVEIRDVLATSPSVASAVEEPTRAALLEVLAHRAMSVEEMVDALEERGIEKAPTTVRHHVDVLREAGLVDLGRLEEDRGGVVKYYAATARLLDYEEPDDFDERMAEALDETAGELADLVDRLREDHGDEIEAMAAELTPCSYCDRQHFEEYVLVRLLQRATADVLHGDAGTA
jgi:DNA-binding transcriptional ArsR family regulator